MGVVYEGSKLFGAVLLSAQSPRMLDIFNGVIYWTTWSGDRLLETNQLGRGNASSVLSGQTSIGAVRFVHSLRYGDYAPSTSSLRYDTILYLRKGDTMASLV